MKARGHSAKPRLVLASGLLCDATIWSDIPARLADYADVSVVSFRGFDSLASMAAHILHSCVGPFALAGHSMGGRVALEVVRNAPARVSALALLNTSVQPVRAGEVQSRGHLLRAGYERGMAALAAEWLPPMLSRSHGNTAEVMRRLRTMITSWSADEYAGQIKAMLNRPDAFSVLAMIQVPTLLLTGSDDRWSPMSQLQTLCRRIPQAVLFEVLGAGHMAPIERPEPVALALREWLGRIRAS